MRVLGRFWTYARVVRKQLARNPRRTILTFSGLVLSFFLVSFRVPTRPVVYASRAERRLRVGCTLVTLVFGWWGIPWGPIWTVQTLRRNLSSAGEVTIAELLEGRSDVQLPPSKVRRRRRG